MKGFHMSFWLLHRSFCLKLAAFFFFILLSPCLQAQTVTKIKIDHPIGPASAKYLKKGIDLAEQSQSSALLIQLDTPGGLALAMRDMMQAIAGASVPVITYVSPTGARAASAGVFLLYASPFAAMAPGTNLGAASPVMMGEQREDANSEAIRKKAMNDAVASIRSFAELYGRNADWAESAVRDGVSLSSEEALKLNVIDAIAKSDRVLLEQIDGSVVLVNHQEQTLATKNASIVPYDPDWRTQLLLVISDPSIAYLLLMAGVTALFLEFAYAGTGVPGVLGAVSIILALYGLQMLPVNYTGLMLMLAGFAFIVLEAFMGSMGFFALLGLVALFFGSVMLIDSEHDAFQIVSPVLFGVLIVAGGLAWLLASLAVRSHRKAVVSGLDYLIGQEVLVQQDHKQRLFVFLGGERWRIDQAIKAKSGDRVEVLGFEGLTVKVKQLEN